MKSEFIGAQAFHANPEVGDKLPGGFHPGLAAELLPLRDPIGANLVKGIELSLRPMRPVRVGLLHGGRVKLVQCNSKF